MTYVIGTVSKLSEFLRRYSKDILPNRRTVGHPLSEHTLAESLRVTRTIDEALDRKVFKAITQAEFVDYFLNGQSHGRDV